jgi:hypothetical protein
MTGRRMRPCHDDNMRGQPGMRTKITHDFVLSWIAYFPGPAGLSEERARFVSVESSTQNCRGTTSPILCRLRVDQ